jgi:hypothetical protein
MNKPLHKLTETDWAHERESAHLSSISGDARRQAEAAEETYVLVRRILISIWVLGLLGLFLLAVN